MRGLVRAPLATEQQDGAPCRKHNVLRDYQKARALRELPLSSKGTFVGRRRRRRAGTMPRQRWLCAEGTGSVSVEALRGPNAGQRPCASPSRE